MTIAIYPGSFDPITNGHIDILKSGAEIFDKVIIAVSYNINKQEFLPIDERVALIKECFKDFPKLLRIKKLSEPAAVFQIKFINFSN